MTERASGWYDDPHDDTLLRYWDGILWSDRTMPKLRPGLEHVGQARPAVPVQQEGASPVARSASGGGQPPSWRPDQAPSARPGVHPGRPGAQDPRMRAFGDTAGKPSGIWRRIAAVLLDRMIVGVPVVLAVLPFVGSWMDDIQHYADSVSATSRAGEQIPAMPDSVLSPPLTMVVALLVATFVYDVVMTSRFGATIGKKALGIRVAPQEADALTEDRLPMARCLVRSGVKALPDLMGLVAVLAALGGVLQIAVLLWALSNPLRQGLDDVAARSVVRRTR